MKIPLFATVILLLGDMIKILITCYSEIFIVFALTFPTSILLLNWFQTSIITFLIALIPILLLNIFCISSLYYCIDRRETGDPVSIWKSFLVILRHFNSISFPLLTEAAIILETFVVFFIAALVVRYFFDFLHIFWSGSIIYWFIIIFLGASLFLSLFILSIIMCQAYFAVLLDHIPFQQALRHGRMRLQASLPYYLFYYILLALFSILFIWKAIIAYLYLGLTVGLFYAIALGVFLGFLLRRKFTLKFRTQEENLSSNQKTHYLFLIIILFGFINYLLIAFLLIKDYQQLLAFIQRQQNNFLASQSVKIYVDSFNGYSLSYPQGWNLYHWNTKSVTFYNNYTGTITGGTWMTINISAYTGNAFDQLIGASPGIIVYDPQSKNITTKISNTTVQGYEAVNYTLIKPGEPYTQYETHYLIHKNKTIYDIAFISLTNDVSEYNSTLFQNIINSVTFLK
ncbi:MAG TPA: PsbP-related protein [Candidatus Sulfotelmatobacter sp.]|nr:PsbP-related protein [Candidatus Sulfotelmatobacter sp.]